MAEAETTPATPAAAPAAEPEWETLERDSDFQELVKTKRSFIVPATIFFLVYYFGFLVVVGYLPDVADAKIFGSINLAYLFALSQFIVAWILMWLYVRRAKVFDKLADKVVAKVKGGNQ